MIVSGDVFLSNESFKCKFIRVGGEVYIGSPDDLSTLHIEIVKKDKILERVLQLKEQDRNEVDGGVLYVSGKMVWVGGVSDSLGIPLTSIAREKTIKRLGERFPSLSVKMLGE